MLAGTFIGNAIISIHGRFPHLKKLLNGSPSCKRKCSVDCFKIVDSANSRHCLKLKEAIYISRLKPELNAQLQHNNEFCFL